MKAHTNQYKENIKNLGRQLDSKITYELEGETIELGVKELNSITPHYEGNILKSVMRQLDIDSTVDIPLETEINYQFGIKTQNYILTADTNFLENKTYYRFEDSQYVILIVGVDYEINDEITGEIYELEENYEYINFGNYIVFSSEKQEDLKSYKIICYDKMLYSMKNYENMNIIYPITIRDYINTICNHLGLTFKNVGTTFANYNRQIQNELYLDAGGNDLGYTFRDVLDELAQVTASTICINEETDELEVRYIHVTDDTINAEYLKNTNANFKEKYGPVNSIVLSRSAESDNVYLRDEESIAENGLCEIKIVDNQIMNFNDRSDYLNDILIRLDGLEYYLNDFVSTGITYYNLCDQYNIEIENTNYKCIMFNDEINITQGLEEHIYTQMPAEAKTDYTKADKTDRRINQTYLIVDKQNQRIDSVVSNVTEQNNKISQITQTVDELNSKIQDIADITIAGESIYAQFVLNNINESEPIMIKIHPTTQNISYLYPRDNLYPEDTLYMPNRRIRFKNLTTNEIFDYELPDDLLLYDSTHYDEFYLDYDSQTCQVTKRCKYNVDGSVSLLDTERIDTYTYPSILLTDGDYEISILGYSNGYLFTRLMTENIYTSQFATKVEVRTQISQTADSINLEVAKKTNKDEIISAINLTPETTTINANKISLTGKNIDLTGDNITITSDNFSVDETGKVTAKSGDIGSWNIYDKGLKRGDFYISYGTKTVQGQNFTFGVSNIYTMSDVVICQAMILGSFPKPGVGTKAFKHFDVNNDGQINAFDLLVITQIVEGWN